MIVESRPSNYDQFADDEKVPWCKVTIHKLTKILFSLHFYSATYTMSLRKTHNKRFPQLNGGQYLLQGGG